MIISNYRYYSQIIPWEGHVKCSFLNIAPSGDAPRSRSMRASSRIATFHKTNPIPDAMVRGPQRCGSKIKAKPPRMLSITISIATILLLLLLVLLLY